MADLVPSTRLIARTDDSRQSTKYPIAVKTQSITVADTTNTKTVSFSINGRPTKLITAAPNVPTDSAYSITFKDEDGNTLYTDASRSDNANAVTDLSGTAYIWSGNTTVTIAFSTALSSNTATFDVKVEYTSTIF